MFRFSCFHAHIHNNKPKRMIHPSLEAMAKNLEDGSRNKASTCLPKCTTSNQLLSETQDDQIEHNKNHGSSLGLLERDWRSEDLKSKVAIHYDKQVLHNGRLKKSQSLGSGLHQEVRICTDNFSEDDANPGFSFNACNSNIASTMPCKKDQEATPPEQYKNILNSEQFGSNLTNQGSIFSIGDPAYSDKYAEDNSDTPPLSGEYVGDSTDLTSGALNFMVKSYSSPNIKAPVFPLENCSFKQAALQSRSFQDLHSLDMKCQDTSIDESGDQVMGEKAKESCIGKAEENYMDSSFDDGYDSYPLSGLVKDWVMPVTDDINDTEPLQGEYSVHCHDKLANEDFKIKRIEEWVTDLQLGGPSEESNESSKSFHPPIRDINMLNNLSSAKVDGKVTPGMEAAKRYISSLGANASAAQLANHGLVVIPFLSAFVSLKVLNLSGNAIVRITAGALPRGLHILNLSKNHVSVIEGLRELTRLRVLDLSYNRILRIGHGLASCSSLKELYLAGNKINEVEGLHRLLKLSILDLRFNRVSTAKSLGQLAANYNSLQAISLEGNPAQKNVGDEQLKKYLQGLLPHLAYYNRQHIRAGTLKDTAERSVRLGIGAHQSDRSFRADHKTAKKSSQSITARRSPSSSNLVRRGQAVASSKQHKGRQGHLPPVGNKVSMHDRYHVDLGSKSSNLKPDFSMRRSSSEGNLGALLK
ncbi:hypothetical protein L6164_022274 [Bauhinia variegata]|uniref:Uncharacterized protein n=1 Tax=Bauhinia variegata TaxID=167791 RepID=A0ACB9MEM5_BAUVA|nr:hypothetical protein L6164_022274 [Bauhinia variegata]